MKLSIIIPVYNEERTVREVVEKVKNLKLPVQKEIIVVNDGSKDNSQKLLSKIRNKDVILIFHKKNMGKGMAIRTGLKRAKGDIIAIQDADLEYNSSNLNYLIKPIMDGKAEVVYGSRFLKSNKIGSLSFYFANKILSIITSILYLKKITDMETCYKVFNKSVLKNINLKCRRFEFEPEFTAKILKKGYKILELPIDYNPRTKVQGKKIKVKDGIIALWTLLKYRFSD